MSWEIRVAAASNICSLIISMTRARSTGAPKYCLMHWKKNWNENTHKLQYCNEKSFSKYSVNQSWFKAFGGMVRKSIILCFIVSHKVMKKSIALGCALHSSPRKYILLCLLFITPSTFNTTKSFCVKEVSKLNYR